MRLQPAVMAMVKRLIKQRRAGKKPFGIDLAVWKEAIEREKGKKAG